MLEQRNSKGTYPGWYLGWRKNLLVRSSAFEYIQWVLTNKRSLEKFEKWNEEIIFKGDMARELKTLATVAEFKKNPSLRMSVIPKRRVNLAIIQAWLGGRQDLDLAVIEALSK